MAKLIYGDRIGRDAERDYPPKPRNEGGTDRAKGEKTRGYGGQEKDHEDDEDQSFGGRLIIPLKRATALGR